MKPSLAFGVFLLSLGLMQAQDPAATLQAVFDAHGVTPASLQAQVLFQGRYVIAPQGRAQESPLIIKTRGFDEVRFEIAGAGGVQATGQFRGFRWSQKGTQRAVDYDGRYSLNLPLMYSPSTGLLAYLLANRSRIVWQGSTSGTLDGLPVVRLQLQVPDPDETRRQIGFSFDRQYELLIDPTSKRLLAASVLLLGKDFANLDLYRFQDYQVRGGLLFASRVSWSRRPSQGRAGEQPGSSMEFNTIVINQHFGDSDFERPAP